MAITSAGRAELFRLRRDIARIEGRLVEAERLSLAARSQLIASSSIALSHSRLAFPLPSGERSSQSVRIAAGEGVEGRRLAAHLGVMVSETRTPHPSEHPDRLPLGILALDSVLSGGLPLATLHEIRAAESREGAAAAGFALALVARLVATGNASSLLWVGEADARRESGELYAPGLAALGLDPAAIVAVAADTDKDALWAFEAGLGCQGLGVAICELRNPSLDLTATRRCLLRASSAGVTGFLLRLGGEVEPSAAELRFRVSAAPAAMIGNFERGVGRVAWRLSLEKNRNGRTGAFTVEWNAHERCFAEQGEGGRDAVPQHFSAPPLNRQADPLAPGRAALRRAS